MVERITITIKKDLLKRIDGMVDKRTVRNRSHAIENILSRSLSSTGLDTALIMAGGHGLGDLPKSMVRIHGKPILEHQINMLRRNGITNILLALGSMDKTINDYFGDGGRLGVSIKYITEDMPMGTAGPIALAGEHIEKSFVLLNVDTLLNPNIYEMYEFHRQNRKMATVLLSTVDDTKHFGVVNMRGNQILNFVEKPKKGSYSKLINAGLCIFERSVVNMVPNRRFMIQELFSTLSRQEQLVGFLHDGKTFDVGTKEGYERAMKEWGK